jgi:hypothetical protein
MCTDCRIQRAARYGRRTNEPHLHECTQNSPANTYTITSKQALIADFNAQHATGDSAQTLSLGVGGGDVAAAVNKDTEEVRSANVFQCHVTRPFRVAFVLVVLSLLMQRHVTRPFRVASERVTNLNVD